jgi:prepilin-type N-terminal cleavage/methylation domain-containing protein
VHIAELTGPRRTGTFIFFYFRYSETPCNSSLRARARSGLHLIELLVVIAIIAILIGLSSRRPEDSRSSQSHELHQQLKQMGLAAHNYEGTYHVLPPGFDDQMVAIR